MIIRTHIFKDFLIKLCFAQKASLDAGEGFLQHFWHAAQAGDGDATWLEKGPKTGPKVAQNRHFWGPLSATPAWKGSPFIIFRLFFASWLSKTGFGIFFWPLQLKKAIFGVPTWPQLRPKNGSYVVAWA